MVIDDRLLMSEHKCDGIVSTLSPNTNDVIWLPKKRKGEYELLDDHVQFVAFQTMLVNPEQPEKASSPMLFRLSGIVSFIKEEQL